MINHREPPILYVDDTVEQRYAMRRILETEGFVVLEAGTGAEALQMLSQNPNLAVVDVKLPDISGYDLSRRLKQRLPHIQILQVSASFRDPNLRVSGFSGGADAYLAQPVHPSELVSLIRRMLRTAEAEEVLRFLAAVGPKLTQSLFISDTAKNIFSVVIPRFADRCSIFLEDSPGSPASFFPAPELDDNAMATLKAHSGLKSIRMVDSRMLVAPLTDRKGSIGVIAFHLGADREYTEADFTLGQDLANRAALALQNCILFSSEQLTRSALVQSEKLATAGRMAGAIAHEINNPLEALTNLLYIIECSTGATESIRELANAALTEVTRIAHITRQTLGFYRDLRTPTNVNLNQTLSDTFQLYSGRFAEKKISVNLEVGENVHIKGIKGEIRQIISNLLINALEAMESEGKMEAIVMSQDDKAVLSISDTGPGIEQELMDKIFEPFFTTKQGTGTGLGLWITKTMVEKHGGEIRVTTQRGKHDHGTRFELRFAKI